MGCDIHVVAERLVGGTWEQIDIELFDLRSYGLFGFLADVRNYSAVPPLAAPRGLPIDLSRGLAKHLLDWEWDGHTPSWFMLSELRNFDYTQQVEDRRYTKQVGPNAWDGGATCEPGQGEMITWQEFLPETYFCDLQRAKEAGVDRIVFWFDN